jgi:tRNA1Val (adenine37-N6)-methyltransferase
LAILQVQFWQAAEKSQVLFLFLGTYVVTFKNPGDEIDFSISRDSLFDGDLICYQSTEGYRFSIDSILIAHFVKVRNNPRILDLGTGCGIIMLLLLYRWQNNLGEIAGIELQKNLVKLAEKNLLVNGYSAIGRVFEGDIKKIGDIGKGGTYDVIVCNPPFYLHGSGRQNANLEASLARHQTLATLEDFLLAASLMVKNKGATYFIYPAEQTGILLSQLHKYRLEVKRLRFIYSYPDNSASARLVLVECRKNGGCGVTILPPFYVYQGKNNGYSTEMQRLYEKNPDPLQ